ncbi:MAG: hemolysin family protein [Planctomycetota bacterium]
MGCSFFFSGSETALFSLTKEDLHRFREQEGRLGHIIHSLLESPKDLLITILFGNMVSNVCFYSLSYGLLVQVRNPLVRTAAGFAPLLCVVICGEVLPKSIAVGIPRQFARVVAIPITVIKKATYFIRIVLGNVIDYLARIIKHEAQEQKYITAHELKMLVDLSQKTGVIDSAERTMLNEIVEMGDTRVKEIMTPRVDMTLFDLSDGREKLRRLVCKTRHSRVPVYEERIDNIIGVIHSKDIFLKPDADLASLIRPIRAVPESQTIESLLREFREEKKQLAIVVDEYGGVEGMVTLEDILEEIVGEIGDEFDKTKIPARLTEDGDYLLAGDLNLRQWEVLFGEDVPLRGVTTLGGFVTALLGHLPREGEHVQYKNLSMTVEKLKHHRVAQVRLHLMHKDGDEGGEQ